MLMICKKIGKGQIARGQ